MCCWNFLFYKKFNFKIGNLPVKGGAQREHLPFFIFEIFEFFDITGVNPPLFNPPILWGGWKNGLVYIYE
jgi:hypothetical protein